jgi:hypothetical protein
VRTFRGIITCLVTGGPAWRRAARGKAEG